MDLNKELSALLASFEESVDRYRSTLKKVQAADFVLENENMKKEIASISKKLEEFAVENSRIRDENTNLKMALNEQILDERLNILKLSKKKQEIYFQSILSKEVNKLAALEQEVRESVRKFEQRAETEFDTEREGIRSEIVSFAEKLMKKIEARREKQKEEERRILQSLGEGYEALSSEPLTEETLQKRMRQNKIELKIGLNWLNKIGVGLILIGLAYAARYSYATWFNDIMRSISFFLLGGLFLGSGEFLYRRGKDVFAKGMLGGGISILYASVFISYFRYEIIDLNIGLALLALITVTAAVLSIRYNSQTIGGFALAGGYLPLATFIYDTVTYSSIAAAPWGGMLGYLFILNLLMLAISFWRRWSIVMYISFVMHLPCFIYIVFNLSSSAAAIIYSVAAFSLYQAIVLLYPLKYKQKLSKPDIIMLGLNTFISCIVIYLLFEKAGLTWVRGILALSFALIYIVLGQFVQRVIKQERETLFLFYATALTFTVLMVPFQFGIHWMTLGWLVEGLILSVVGNRQKIKYMEWGGWIITALCVASFYFFDFTMYFADPGAIKYFKIKYASVTGGTVILMIMYLKAVSGGTISRYSKMGKIITGYKYFVVFTFWLFITITGLHHYDKLVALIYEKKPYIMLDHSFYRSLIFAVINISLAYGLSKFKLVHDRVVQYFNMFLYGLAILICIILNASSPVLAYEYVENTALNYVALGILIVFNIIIFLAGRDLLLRILMRLKANMEFYPLIIGVYLLALVTSMVVVQFRLGDVNLVLSFAYLFLAIGSIVYGFKQKYAYIRLFGLGVLCLALAKLFIWDLRFLETSGKIIAYFGFGICLLLVSFIYQKIKHKMDVPDASINK